MSGVNTPSENIFKVTEEANVSADIPTSNNSTISLCAEGSSRDSVTTLKASVGDVIWGGFS